MHLKKKKSNTPGTRHQINITKTILSKKDIYKNLKIKRKKSGGRNNTGRITVRHIGGGCKNAQHNLNSYNFYYRALVVLIQYNSTSNSFIDLNFDLNSKRFFKTINIKGILPGSLINSSINNDEIKLGVRTYLKNFPLGSLISVINKAGEFRPKFGRSAGSFCQLVEKSTTECKIKLPSGKLHKVNNQFLGSFGTISNEKSKNISTGKAGKSRLKGIRPSVRGVAMNPVDHPHGGKSNKGMSPVTPWGIPTKGKPTRKYE